MCLSVHSPKLEKTESCLTLHSIENLFNLLIFFGFTAYMDDEVYAKDNIEELPNRDQKGMNIHPSPTYICNRSS